MNIEYLLGPVNVKCDCGHYMFKDYLFHDDKLKKNLYGVLKCPYCKSTIQVDTRVWFGLESSH